MNKKLVLVTSVLVLSLAAMVIMTGCQPKQEAKGKVVIASKIDTEGALLGSMIVQLLDHHGYETVDKTEFGTTEVIRKAIRAEEIDIYPEYTGNVAFFHNDADNPAWKDPQEAYARAVELDEEAYDLRWLQPAPANNTWAIAVRQDLADQNSLLTLEDLAEYVNNGGNLKLACSEEFASRQGALPSFEEAYDFKLEKDQLLILSGGNTATTERAAAEQTDGVNAAMAYGTDGALAALGLVVLEDNRNVQHVYQPAPLVRGEVLEKYPEIETILNPVFGTLDLKTLQSLNSRLAVHGEAASDVAKEYLQENGLLK
ncbi:MAG: ABC transporter substrate-binding protein [Spirochaetaceae bacterium]|nr:ABC transporter substrate-binding protein [Spirochaetaceae bacterium]MCF7948502.1 ABC transporter substrate-binding protein [Spirochaetia bacterium]MCF7951436.1 ABC transporter substrate-binding protein [Spirochaetaceae bacterium]